MKKKQFAAVFKNAIANHAAYIGVGIQTEGSSRPEIIINPIENFEEKLKYYRAAYDEDMVLVSAKGKKDIRIIAVAWGDSFSDIEFQMTENRQDWKKTISDAIDRVVNRMLGGMRMCRKNSATHGMQFLRDTKSSSFLVGIASDSRGSSQKMQNCMRICSRPA